MNAGIKLFAILKFLDLKDYIGNKKYQKDYQFDTVQEIIRGFYYRAWGADFAGAVMISIDGHHEYGKKD